MSLLAKPGDVALCEDITYPSIRAVAAQLGVRLIGLAMDEHGICVEAFAKACAEHDPKLLYCNPTLQNPTTVTISAARRRELIRIARNHGVAIVEDDAYGVLPSTAEASLLAVRAESVARQRLARELLADAHYVTHPESFHLWLTPQAGLQRGAFAAQLLRGGIQAVTSDAFSVGTDPPEALRICLGGACSRDDIREVLATIARVLQMSPEAAAPV